MNPLVTSDASPGCTMVGIPANMVYSEGERDRKVPRFLDFEHRKLPGPVEFAIQTLNSRAFALERQLDSAQKNQDWLTRGEQ